MAKVELKKPIVEEISGLLDGAKAAVVVDYRGLTVEEDTRLRKELREAGLDTIYAEHGRDLFPTDSNGVPFTAAYFAAVGDPLADISEDMAAEQKARAVYENLINLTDDPDVIAPLLFLRQREIIHFNRFKELYKEYKQKGYK